MENKNTIIDKRSLAVTLNFMGLNYKKDYKENREIYVFEETEKFKFALARILDTRQLINNY